MDPQEAMERHTHDATELVLVLAGRGTHDTRDEEYRIAQGDVFVIQGDEEHGYRDTSRLALVNILFDVRRLGLPRADLGHVAGHHVLFEIEPRLRRRRHTGARLCLGPEDLEHAADLVARIEAELANGAAGFRFLATALLMQLLGFLSRCCSDIRPVRGEAMLRIGRVLSYLNHHFAEPIHVGALTRLSHMSPSSLRRAFREAVGVSPMTYLIRLRVRRGAELLRAPDARVTDVAYQVGFSDGNYFSRQFRQVLGLSPREYKRRALLLAATRE
jgi:AraC-like DNA-binding protein